MEIKILSFLQQNPQNNDRITDFSNSFTQQTQQFLCKSNSYLKGPQTTKSKKKTEKQTQQPSCSTHLNKGTENVRQQNTKI